MPNMQFSPCFLKRERGGHTQPSENGLLVLVQENAETTVKKKKRRGEEMVVSISRGARGTGEHETSF
jgi:hypothetical protein